MSIRDKFWRSFPKHKPKEDGWYICTINYPFDTKIINNDHYTRYGYYVMELYWYGNMMKFIDNKRMNVFNEYKVTDHDNEIIKKDNLCDRTNSVVAWKKRPKAYRVRGRLYYEIEN